MKKLLLILSILVLASPVYGATRYAVGTGNWFTAATWSDVGCADAGPGTVPGNGDDVDLCDHVVTWDVATGAGSLVIPATGRLGTITGNTGGIIVDASLDNCSPASGDKADAVCKIYFTTATAGSGQHLLTIDDSTSATSDHTILIDGTECKGATGATKHCIYHDAIRVRAYVDVALTGAASGSASQGMKINANGALATTTKNITGGGVNGAYGLYNLGNASSIVTVESGTVTGGSALGADGIYNASGAQAGVVLNSGVLLVNTATNGAMRGPFSWGATSAAGSWNINSKYYGTCPAAADVDTDATTLNIDTGAFDTGTKSGGGGGGAWGF